MSKTQEPYVVYKKIIQKVMLDPEQLPALPAVTLKIRSSVANPDSSSQDIAQICSQDPAFSTLVMANVSSATYVQANPPKSLDAAISVLGREKIQSLAMAYSVKSLFVIRSAHLKQLYQKIWQRMMLKAGTSAYLATRTQKFQAEEILLTSLLTEVGTLATLSAFAEFESKPDQKVFFRLCREYAKAFGAILLKKWEVGDHFIESLKLCGRWRHTVSEQLSATDVVNMGLYCTVKKLSPNNSLPPIANIPSFRKLPPQMKDVDDQGILKIVSDNMDAIDTIQRVLH